MKKLVLGLMMITLVGCGDELARFFKCDDVCEKMVDECLSFLPYRTIPQLRDQCMENCEDEASAELLDCLEETSCGDVYLGGRCW